MPRTRGLFPIKRLIFTPKPIKMKDPAAKAENKGRAENKKKPW